MKENARFENPDTEIEENTLETNKWLFWNKEKENCTVEEVKTRLESVGVEKIELEGVKEVWQYKIADAVETMCEKYPELQNYIGSIKAKELPEGTFACAGPKTGENGFGTEIQINRSAFEKGNLEVRIVNSEIKNYKGESWIAGRGVDGILKHEMAHILHLKLIADSENLEYGEYNRDKYKKITEKFNHNAIVTSMCYDTLKEFGISYCDVGRELSLYADHDFGEFFAEAISECETAKKPRRVAVSVRQKYEDYKKDIMESNELGGEL